MFSMIKQHFSKILFCKQNTTINLKTQVKETCNIWEVPCLYEHMQFSKINAKHICIPMHLILHEDKIYILH